MQSTFRLMLLLGLVASAALALPAAPALAAAPACDDPNIVDLIQKIAREKVARKHGDAVASGVLFGLRQMAETARSADGMQVRCTAVLEVSRQAGSADQQYVTYAIEQQLGGRIQATLFEEVFIRPQ